MIDPTNPVVSLCAFGMAAEGIPADARRLFEQAWAARRNDYEAAIAAHFVARHQDTAAETLHWNALAVRHAEAVTDGSAGELLPSLYLNLADAYEQSGLRDAAVAAVHHAAERLAAVPAGGYHDFLAMGIARLARRLQEGEGEGEGDDVQRAI